MKIDADVVLRIHIHDGQKTDEENKEILAKFNENPDEYMKRFSGYINDMAKERFNDEIADGYFKVSTEVESFTIEE